MLFNGIKRLEEYCDTKSNKSSLETETSFKDPKSFTRASKLDDEKGKEEEIKSTKDEEEKVVDEPVQVDKPPDNDEEFSIDTSKKGRDQSKQDTDGLIPSKRIETLKLISEEDEEEAKDTPPNV